MIIAAVAIPITARLPTAPPAMAPVLIGGPGLLLVEPRDATSLAREAPPRH